MATKGSKKKIKRSVDEGVVHIHATFSNTVITVSHPQGDVIAWSSGGARGFRGTRKGTPFAAQVAAEDVAKRAMGSGMKSARVYVKGPGPGREAAIRSIQAAGLRVSSIRDVTPIPHNGCRPRGRRRV
ncbi:MAG: 30S ribosomal protein S11 [Candidatus Dadabacteria bacterium]|nr:30S ribosomal protein S11 [Candidatus Dadabacteria bacterium]MCY4042687.1 30S ribosomal protein S11 [Candidatus Dadabacteria bacterium]MCY4047408.1 30S ribosomal protein S11 [Candidatus Dadabacteria bacterium]